MTEDQPKRGRPRKYGKRLSFNFRYTVEMRKKLLDSAAKNGRSLSEEVEYRVMLGFTTEANQDDIARQFREATEMRAKAAARLSADEIQAVRLAALMILRESGRARRVIIDYDALLAEGDGLLRGLRGGFTADEAPVPTPPTLTAAEAERVNKEIESQIGSLRKTTAPKEQENKVA
jgi:hypothetical protein